MEREWSEYQKNIFRFVKDAPGNAGVIAVAGSAKTTTAEHSMDYINRNLRVRFGCFNNHIKKELEERVGHLMNAEVMTYNAFG